MLRKLPFSFDNLNIENVFMLAIAKFLFFSLCFFLVPLSISVSLPALSYVVLNINLAFSSIWSAATATGNFLVVPTGSPANGGQRRPYSSSNLLLFDEHGRVVQQQQNDDRKDQNYHDKHAAIAEGPNQKNDTTTRSMITGNGKGAKTADVDTNGIFSSSTYSSSSGSTTWSSYVMDEGGGGSAGKGGGEKVGHEKPPSGKSSRQHGFSIGEAMKKGVGKKSEERSGIIKEDNGITIEE